MKSMLTGVIGAVIAGLILYYSFGIGGSDRRVERVVPEHHEVDRGVETVVPERRSNEASGYGNYCCDPSGNRRCTLVESMPIGSSCVCFGQGYGFVCR